MGGVWLRGEGLRGVNWAPHWAGGEGIQDGWAAHTAGGKRAGDRRGAPPTLLHAAPLTLPLARPARRVT